MGLRKAGTLLLAGLAAGTITLLAAPSPAGAVGARPVDPTNTPAGSNSSTGQSSSSASTKWGATAPGDSSWWF